jgi:bifunctional DNA-binding transcriptional regulator/antitoxin component of YhaV-PrlF toxin-antitoxin module
MKIAKITTGGQISLPAELRRRWGTQRVRIDDEGDHAVVRPVPDDPVAAARGAWKHLVTVPTEELRRIAREDERRAEERRVRQFRGQ